MASPWFDAKGIPHPNAAGPGARRNILASGALIPRLLRSFAIVRMNGFEPIKPEALVEAKPSKRDPLRARPGPAPIGPRQKYELRNTGR